MNCNKAKKIDLYSYLKKNCFKPKKETKNEAWFLSPFRVEKTPSFKVNLDKNIWYDFGLGLGGTIIDFVMKYNNCSIKEALSILSSNTFSFHQQPKTIATNKEPNYEVTKVGKLKHPNLISYIQQRKLNYEFTEKFCFQVHYTFDNGNEYYSIGFLNDSGGFEIRNKYFKGCLGKKNITFINNHFNVAAIFESWSDFIAYLTYLNEIPEENFIILNSTALVKKVIDLISDFKKVRVFVDNDFSGSRVTEIIKNNCKNEFEDCRILYKNHKDLNEFLIYNSNVNC